MHHNMKPVGYTISVTNSSRERMAPGTHITWWCADDHNISDLLGVQVPVYVSAKDRAQLHANFLNERDQSTEAVVVELYGQLLEPETNLSPLSFLDQLPTDHLKEYATRYVTVGIPPRRTN